MTEIAIMQMDHRRYLMLSADTTQEQAEQAFARRYGEKPEAVFRLYPGREVCAGPEPRKEGEG